MVDGRRDGRGAARTSAKEPGTGPSRRSRRAGNGRGDPPRSAAVEPLEPRLLLSAYAVIPANYLDVGNRWNYEVHVSHQDYATVSFDTTMTKKVARTENVAGLDTAVVEHNFANGDSIDWYAYLTDQHLVLARVVDSIGGERITAQGGDALEVATFTIGDTAAAEPVGQGVFDWEDLDGPSTQVETDTSTQTYLGRETVTVGAGTIECTKVAYRAAWIRGGISGYEEYTLWIDPAIGWVQGVHASVTSGVTESRYTFSLTSHQLARGANEHDLNRDGKADLPWRNRQTGANSAWFLDGGTVLDTPALTPVTSSTWSIGGIGDFNGNGYGDLLWHESSGAVILWMMDGATLGTSASLPGVSSSWRPVGAGDFNNDGFSDILWRAADGENHIWFLNGPVLDASLAIPAAPGAGWTAVGVGDFDADRHADILWRHTDGTNRIWFMDGAEIVRTADTLSRADSDWSVGSVGDFDGDGYADILWRSAAGANQLWFMVRETWISSVALPELDSAWQLPGSVGPASLDLAVSNLTGVGGTYRLRQAIAGRVYVENRGNTPVAPVAFEGRLSLDAIWGNADDVVCYSEVDADGLGAYEAFWDADFATVPAGTPAGAYFLAVAIDPGAQIDESDETNNVVWTQSAEVLVRGGNHGDLNGDGKADLIWRNVVDGTNQVWFMDGATIAAPAELAQVDDLNWTPAGRGDFNADGYADLLWRNTVSGENILWTMNAETIVAAAAVDAVPPDWSINGVGDFNGDGKADILWRHAAGDNALWYMDNASLLDWADLGNIGTDWNTVGAGDFNGDGFADILWRHADGSNALWFMSSHTMLDAASLPAVGDPTWSVGSVGDFNGDGKADILWRNPATQQNVMWTMDGGALTGTAYLPPVGGWELPGTYQPPQPEPLSIAAVQGDFDGDGHGDILWRHSSGQNHLWFMNGATIREGVNLPWVGDTNWNIAGVGDFDGDGKSDILWRHAVVGQNHIWYMGAGGIAAQAGAPTVGDTNWQVGSVADYDGDGKADLLWRHSSGVNIVWFMDGESILSSTELLTVPAPDWDVI